MQKKIFLFLFLFCTLISRLHAQIVTIPDNNFKNKLIALGKDLNNDGNIQVSEALAVTSLNVNLSSITSLTGIEAFSNLVTLKCVGNSIQSLDLTSLNNLAYLECQYNPLTSLVVDSLPNLTMVYCHNNLFTTLDVSGCSDLSYLSMGSPNILTFSCPNLSLTDLYVGYCTNLQSLDCHGNQITSLDVTDLTNLQTLDCHDNNIPSLNLTACTALVNLNCNSNLIQGLSLTNCSSLQSLDCSVNPIGGSLNTSTCPNLQQLDCHGDGLTGLIVTGCTNLSLLFCQTNQLTNLNLSGLGGLQEVNCAENVLTNLTLTGCTNLQALSCQINQLVNLNASNLSNLQTLNCSDNPLLNLNVTACVGLTDLIASGDDFTSLDVNTCIALQQLYCNSTGLINLNITGASNLQVLDLTYCGSLQSLTCANLQLNDLRVHECPALQTLNCANNQLDTLSLINTTALLNFNCSHNLFTVIPQATLTFLADLDCSYNPVAELDVESHNIISLVVANCANLQRLTATYSQLVNLDVSACTSLSYLNCMNGNLAIIDVSTCSQLDSFICSGNPITSLNVSMLTNLSYLTCNQLLITSLDVSGLTNLETLDISNNASLTNLNVNACTSLATIYGNYISGMNQLDLSGVPSLFHLECNNSLLTSLDLTGCTGLVYLDCSYNQLTSLDVSTCPDINFLKCNDNSLLTTLLIKNGSTYAHTPWGFCLPNPNLQYVCCDAATIYFFEDLFANNLMPNVEVNSLCAYQLGGNYNTILGKDICDADMNACTATDPIYPFLKQELTNGIDTGYVFTNLAGDYITYVDSGNYTLSPTFQNPTYFTTSPAIINFPNNLNNVQTSDFCIVPNGIIPDVGLVLVPIRTARPGFDAYYKLLLQNKGNTIASGNISVDFQGSNMTFLSSTVSPSSQNANQLTWTYSNLQPFESRSITFVMNILPPPTNNIGEMLNFAANATLTNDVSTNDNTFNLAQGIVGAFDPNDKTCLEGAQVLNSQIGEYLHYLIRFQNTGTYAAKNIVVVDSINADKYDISSMQVLETSHDAHIDLKNNVLQFYFENIQLPDSFSNEPASHGYVLFKIKTKANLPVNSFVENEAAIYFDFNHPIITNTATTTFSNSVSMDAMTHNIGFQYFPNPAQNSLTIISSQTREIQLVNVMGEVVLSQEMQGLQTVDISSLSSGIYWVKEKNKGMGEIFIKK